MINKDKNTIGGIPRSCFKSLLEYIELNYDL